MTCHRLIGNRIGFTRTWSLWIGTSQNQFNNEWISRKPGGSFGSALITRGREEHRYEHGIVPPWEGFPLWTSLCTVNVRRQMWLTSFQAAANISLFHNKTTLFFAAKTPLHHFSWRTQELKFWRWKKNKYVCGLERTTWFKSLFLKIFPSILVKPIIKCWKMRYQTVR